MRFQSARSHCVAVAVAILCSHVASGCRDGRCRYRSCGGGRCGFCTRHCSQDPCASVRLCDSARPCSACAGPRACCTGESVSPPASSHEHCDNCFLSSHWMCMCASASAQQFVGLRWTSRDGGRAHARGPLTIIYCKTIYPGPQARASGRYPGPHQLSEVMCSSG